MRLIKKHIKKMIGAFGIVVFLVGCVSVSTENLSVSVQSGSILYAIDKDFRTINKIRFGTIKDGRIDYFIDSLPLDIPEKLRVYTGYSAQREINKMLGLEELDLFDNSVFYKKFGEYKSLSKEGTLKRNVFGGYSQAELRVMFAKIENIAFRIPWFEYGNGNETFSLEYPDEDEGALDDDILKP